MNTQLSSGISMDYAKPQWPVRLAVGIYQSDGEITRSEPVPGSLQCIAFFFCFGETTRRTIARSSLREVSPGADKIWVSASSRTRAYIGGGPAFASVSISNPEQGVRVGDSSAGLWAHAGFARLDQPYGGAVRLNWGFDLRALTGTRLKLAQASANLDYIQLGFLAGVSW